MSDYQPVEIPQGLENDGPPDHSEYIPPAAPVESNTEDNGLGDSTGGNTSVQEGTGNSGGNPAWSPLLEKVPSPFHAEIQPFLSEWDKNFERVQSQYAPYKSFAERQITPEAINNSLQLAQLINANPRLVYDQLGSRFGFASGQGQEEDNDDNDQNLGGEDLEEGNEFPNPIEDPRLKPYLEQQARMSAFLEEQQAQAEERQLDQQIQQEWTAIERAHGSTIPADVKTEMVRRAIWIGDQTGKEPSLQDGYNDYNAFVTKVRGQKANNTAPSVFNGNGGLPSTPNGITANMSDEERIAYIADKARLLNSDN